MNELKSFQREFVRDAKLVPEFIDYENNQIHRECFTYYQMCLKLIYNLITDKVLSNIKLRDIASKLDATISDLFDINIDLAMSLTDLVAIKMMEYQQEAIEQELFETAANFQNFDNIKITGKV